MENPCSVTEQEFICQARKLLPRGRLLADQASGFLDLTDAIAATYHDRWQDICALFIEAIPCTADETLSEWAEIFAFDCEALPTDPVQLRALICELITTGRQLNLATVQALGAAQGITVTGMEWDKTLTTDTPATPVTGWRTGLQMVGVVPGGRGNVSTPADDLAQQPCTEDCDNAQGDTPPSVAHLIACPENSTGTIRPNCEDVGGASGSTLCCGGGVGFRTDSAAYVPPGENLFRPANPWTLNISVDASSLPDEVVCCFTRANSITNRGHRVGIGGPPDFDLEICGLRELAPAYVTIKYIADCDI